MDIKRIMILFLLLLLFGWIVSKCGTNDYCPKEEAYEGYENIYEQFEDFTDYLTVYASAKMNISPGDVNRLNNIENTMIDLEVPACLDNAKYYSISSMGRLISSVALYRSGDYSGSLQALDDGTRFAMLADKEFAKFRKCYPNCTKKDME